MAQRMLDDIEQVVDIKGCIAVYLEANNFIKFITKIRQPFLRQPALPAASLLVFNSSPKYWTGLPKRAAQNKPTSSVGMYITRTKIYRKKSGWCDAENKDFKRLLCFLNKYNPCWFPKPPLVLTFPRPRKRSAFLYLPTSWIPVNKIDKACHLDGVSFNLTPALIGCFLATC